MKVDHIDILIREISKEENIPIRIVRDIIYSQFNYIKEHKKNNKQEPIILQHLFYILPNKTKVYLKHQQELSNGDKTNS